MINLKISTASINTLALNIQHNMQLMNRCISDATENKADVLLLPELAISGYGCEDMFLVPSFVEACWQALMTCVECLPVEAPVVAIGLPLAIPGDPNVYNACALIHRQRVLGIACKQSLAKTGVHYEPRWFSPWPKEETRVITYQEQQILVGELLIELNGIRFGFEICEDAWVNERLGQRLADSGVDVILNPSASHFAIAKHAVRMDIVQHGAEQFDCIYAYTNLIGCEAGRMVYDGGNLVCTPAGFIQLGKRFSFNRTQIEQVNVLVQPKLSQNPLVKVVSYKLPKKLVCATNLNAMPVLNPAVEDALEVTLKALALGLWDWQVKTKQKGYVVSLSGGADSALCACLIYLAHVLAKSADEKAYLKIILKLGLDIAQPILPQVLTTVYQSTQHSGDVTTNAAQGLAHELGTSHHHWSIDDEVKGYVEKAASSIGRGLTWQQDDIALQNIQARARAPGVWLLANIEQKLLIATSNLSEASVGYCTMDGDTAGVLAPIGGVSKSLVLKLNDYLCIHGLDAGGQKIKIAALEAIIHQAPTAELKPTEQQDELDLMPFEVMDKIRVLAQVGRLLPAEIIARLLSNKFTNNYPRSQIEQFVSKYFQLYVRNQWKRERLAVSFHIEEDSACPKTYRRYPVLSHLTTIE